MVTEPRGAVYKGHCPACGLLFMSHRSAEDCQQKIAEHLDTYHYPRKNALPRK